MRILIISHKPPYPPVDGGTLATLNMCLGLAKAGNNVTVLTLSTQKHPSSLEIIPNEIKALINFEIFHVNIKTNILGYILNFLFSLRPYNIERYINTPFKRLIKRILVNEKFDVVQLEGLYLYPYINTIRKYFKGTISLRSHNVEHQIWLKLADNEPHTIKRIYFEFLAKRLARVESAISDKVDALVAIAEPDRQWFVDNNFTKPTITIPAGYLMEEVTEELEPVDFPAICYIGALDWLPNVEGLNWFLNWVWPRIQSEIPEMEFHIAGRNASEELAERLITERNIIFHGQVANSSAFLSRCPIMVVPLLSGSGIRIKIVEGMYLQRAIVATSMAVKGIDLEHEKHILIADNPDDFAKAVCTLIYNPDLGKSIAQNAMEYARKNLDAIELANKLTEFYKQLVG
jgi:glycosyltransferase involved in cell wall biosynthesis